MGPEKLFHQTIIEAHQLSIVVKLKHQLPRAHFRFLVKKHFRAEVPLKLIQCRPDVRVQVNFCRRVPAARPPRCQSFDLTNG